jgi:hypothetical protein
MPKRSLDSESVCCHGDCNQGRNCPRYVQEKSRREVETSLLVCALILAVMLLLTWILR